MTESTSASNDPKQRLDRLRESLLRLHKALIDSERVGYESAFGTIHSPNQFLQLLLQDPWFAWLKPLSELMVKIDETLDADEPLTAATSTNLLAAAHQLLKPSESEPGFGQHYFAALQREPDVVLAHADVLKALKKP
jgi:hypothetical protein